MVAAESLATAPPEKRARNSTVSSTVITFGSTTSAVLNVPAPGPSVSTGVPVSRLK